MEDPEPPPDTHLTRAIRNYLAHSGESARGLSLKVGKNPTLVRKILAGESQHPRGDTLSKLAAAMGMLPAELMPPAEDPRLLSILSGEAEREATYHRPNAGEPYKVELPTRASMPRDLPVYGTSAGSPNDGAFSINFGDVVDRVRRPPGLIGNTKAYAFYVTGDSMEPAYLHGELLVADPSKPCRVGDRVNISVKAPDHEGAEERMSYVKELVRRQPDKVTVKQFNPPKELTFATDRILSMHRILSLGEVMGF